MNVRTKFVLHSFTRSWDNSDWRLKFSVGVANPQSWERAGRRGSEMVPFERALASSYSPSFQVLCNFSSIYTRFRDIATFVLQHATFPSPPLGSPKFLHVPLVGDGLWTMKSDGAGLIVHAISFQDFKPMWSWSTNVTSDRQTYRQTALCNRNTALCTIDYSALRGNEKLFSTNQSIIIVVRHDLLACTSLLQLNTNMLINVTKKLCICAHKTPYCCP